MAKTMACIKDGVVTNLMWVDDSTIETDELKNIYSLHINVGDRYEDFHYYRDDVEVMSHRGQLRKNIKDYDAALNEIAMLMNAAMVISDDAIPSIEERKQAILIAIDSMKQALEAITEGGS